MQIELKGRNVQVSGELREHVEKRFSKLGRQVSDLARLELEVAEERNPANPECHCARATLYLKGATLHAEDSARDLRRAIHLVEEELVRQVQRHKEKRFKRRQAHRAADALRAAAY